MSMDAIDVLMEARAYIEKGWCQGNYAQGVQQSPAPVESARSWCVLGAIAHGAGNPDPTRIDLSAAEMQARDLITEVVSGGAGWSVDVADWTAAVKFNDTVGRTQEEVLEAFDRAIGIGLERAGER
jgi:hypothetical protein